MESVRMGELKVSTKPGFDLAAIGLGSCIGVALADTHAGVVGLAHVVLPQAPAEDCESAAKYADTAVPALIHAVVAAGAHRRRLEAVLCGGARMFPTGLDIGNRNAAAVSAALQAHGISILAADTGGQRGRTARVEMGNEISSQLAGGARQTLMTLNRPTRTYVRTATTTAVAA
jgi:chemotaxis protein CheD